MLFVYMYILLALLSLDSTLQRCLLTQARVVRYLKRYLIAPVHSFSTNSSLKVSIVLLLATMATTIATIHNTMATHCSDSDSDDDSDVAFAYMDFNGVAFEDESDTPTQEENCIEINYDDKVPLGDESPNDIPTKDDCKQVLEEKTVKHAEPDTPSEEVEGQTHDVLQSADTNDQTTYASTEHYQRSKALSSIIFPDVHQLHLNDINKKLLAIEKDILLPRSEKDTTVATLKDDNDDNKEVKQVKQLFDMLENGKYAEILRSEVNNAHI